MSLPAWLGDLREWGYTRLGSVVCLLLIGNGARSPSLPFSPCPALLLSAPCPVGHWFMSFPSSW